MLRSRLLESTLGLASTASAWPGDASWGAGLGMCVQGLSSVGHRVPVAGVAHTAPLGPAVVTLGASVGDSARAGGNGKPGQHINKPHSAGGKRQAEKQLGKNNSKHVFFICCSAWEDVLVPASGHPRRAVMGQRPATEEGMHWGRAQPQAGRAEPGGEQPKMLVVPAGNASASLETMAAGPGPEGDIAALGRMRNHLLTVSWQHLQPKEGEGLLVQDLGEGVVRAEG